MKTETAILDESNIDPAVIERAGNIIKKGGLVAFPTETVYGLGGDALNPQSSAKIYAAKGRPSDNPLIVHISGMEALDPIVTKIPDNARKLADAYWPGPLTMIFNKKPIVPRETTGGLDTVAVRMPSSRIARALIDAAGGYIAAPSANLSGRPSPTSASYVIEDMDGRIDMILDGGDSEVGLESTIVDFTGEYPVILRPGYITAEMISSVLEMEVGIDPALKKDDPSFRPKAPGMKYRHYAPKGELVIVTGPSDKVVSHINELVAADRENGLSTGVMASKETAELYRADSVKALGSKGRAEETAHSLFRALREFDDEKTERIYSESFDETGVGAAIMNRLIKAAGHHVIQL
ncbi:MAG: threonylcarbamoyl-AMP synthase [Lachnospiraceae bacterium]|nr:threonylcarbamoyl-AMP synthase [Lachnospiraceae bacterium]